MSGISHVVRPVQADTPTVHIRKLHARIKEAIGTYEDLARRAEPELRPVAENFLELHRRHHGEIDRAMVGHGLHPDEGGGIVGAVHHLAIAIKDLVGDVDRSLLPSIVKGERGVVELYGECLAEGNPDDVIALLERQQGELAALVDRHDTGQTSWHPS